MSDSKLIEELERALADANQQVERALKDLSANFSRSGRGQEWREFHAAYEQVLSVERKLAAAKHEEHVIPVEFPVQWETGAPLPYLLCNDYRTYLTFFLREVDPHWDGTDVNIRNAASSAPASVAIVEFKHCIVSKMGSPNDEVHSGHPWAGKGLRSYTAQEVVHSLWLAEIEAINRVHRCYNADLWKTLHHYVFWFHDSTVECIAESFTVTSRNDSMSVILADLCEKLLH